MKKFSKRLIPYSVFIGLLIAIAVFVYSLIAFQREEEFTIDSLIVGIAVTASSIVFVVFVLYEVLYYNLSGYELNETQIICKRGVLFKQKTILDYSKINSVNKKQNILQKLLGISVLMADSGSTSRAHQAEIMIIEDTEKVDELYNLLKSIDKNTSTLQLDINAPKEIAEEENLYRFNSKSKMVYSFVNSLTYLIIALFVFGLIFGILYICYLYPGKLTDETLTLQDVIFGSLIVYALMILLSILGNVVRAFVGYYNYKITKVNDTINVQYGLFVNTHNSFNLSRVKGVIVSQGIFQRLFKLATIKIEVIGYLEYSNNAGNNAVVGMLIPLCKLDDVNAYLEKIIPSHIPMKQEAKSKSFISFISWNTLLALIIGLIALIPAILIPLAYESTLALIISTSAIGGIFVIYELILILDSLFGYHNQNVCFNEQAITVHSGSFVKSSTIIDKKNIIAIEDITTVWRAKKGIYSYVIHFHTNALTNTKVVKNVDEKYKDMLLDCLKY